MIGLCFSSMQGADNILMTNAVCLHVSMQVEDILEHTNVKCHCVHFSQLVEHCMK